MTYFMCLPLLLFSPFTFELSSALDKTSSTSMAVVPFLDKVLDGRGIGNSYSKFISPLASRS